jgi:hypothetical protein
MISTLSSFLFVDKSPITLRNILSTRAIITTMVEKISTELVNENMFVNEIKKIDYNHEVIPYTIFILCILYLINKTYISTPKLEKLEKIEVFSKNQKMTSRFILIFMLIFTKNIDSVI